MAAFDSIIFVARDKMDLYFGGKILTFPFLPTFINDLEVVDKELFRTQIFSFLDKNETVLGSCIILLSESVCFISEPVSKEQNIEGVLNSFLTTLPFENPVARVIEDRIVGTNKDLYQAIAEMISQRGGKVRMISPSFLAKETFGKKGLDEAVVKFIFENEDSFIKASFNYDTSPPIGTAVQKQLEKRTKREIILIGVFIVLFLGFAVWLLTRLL